MVLPVIIIFAATTIELIHKKRPKMKYTAIINVYYEAFTIVTINSKPIHLTNNKITERDNYLLQLLLLHWPSPYYRFSC